MDDLAARKLEHSGNYGEFVEPAGLQDDLDGYYFVKERHYGTLTVRGCQQHCHSTLLMVLLLLFDSSRSSQSRLAARTMIQSLCLKLGGRHQAGTDVGTEATVGMISLRRCSGNTRLNARVTWLCTTPPSTRCLCSAATASRSSSSTRWLPRSRRLHWGICGSTIWTTASRTARCTASVSRETAAAPTATTASTAPTRHVPVHTARMTTRHSARSASTAASRASSTRATTRSSKISKSSRAWMTTCTTRTACATASAPASASQVSSARTAQSATAPTTAQAMATAPRSSRMRAVCATTAGSASTATCVRLHAGGSMVAVAAG